MSNVLLLAGVRGAKGADGLSVVSAAVDVNGDLLLTMSDATVVNAGYVVGSAGTDGADGTDGRGITTTAIDGTGHLIITYTDGSTQDAGLVSSGGVVAAAWGGITGTLSAQTDLQTALNAKADTAALSAVATSGAYADLSGTPVIPSTAADVGADPAGTAASAVSAHAGSATAHAVATGSTNGFMSSTDKTKLDGVASGATANSSDATLLSRVNHTGTQLASTISDFSAAAKAAVTQVIPVACGDEVSAITAGAAKVTFRMPFGFTLTSVRASLTTAQTSGATLTVDVNEAGVSVLSTKLTVDNGEKSSTTAAVPAVISDATLANDAEITIDVDQIGDGTATGLKVYLIGTVA